MFFYIECITLCIMLLFQNTNCLRTRISPARGPGLPTNGSLKSVTHLPFKLWSIHVTWMAEHGSTLVLIAPESNATLQLYKILASYNEISGDIVFLITCM